MTIASIKNKVVFGCDGTNTIFSFDFKVFKEEHLKVYIVDGDIETLLTLNTDYAVSGLSEDSVCCIRNLRQFSLLNIAMYCCSVFSS